MTTSTKTPSERRSDAANDIIREALDTVGEAGAEVEGRLADAAAATEAGVRTANATLRGRSDLSLGLLGAFTLGVTTGFLVGGAHRLLTVASLIPAALVGGVILDRVDHQRSTSQKT